MKKKIQLEIISSLLIMLFLYTAISKIVTYNHFRLTLEKSPLLNKVYPVVAAGLPTLEIIIAILLFLPATKKLGLYASFILMLLFTFYVGYMLAFVPYKELPCSCGGVLTYMKWPQHLVFNIVFTLIALAGIVINKRQFDEVLKPSFTGI